MLKSMTILVLCALTLLSCGSQQAEPATADDAVEVDAAQADSIAPDDGQSTAEARFRGFELRAVLAEGDSSASELICEDGSVQLADEVIVGAADITSVDVADAVVVHLNDEATARLSEYTSANVGARLAIVVDGSPLSAPTIQDAINGGVVRIQGCESMTVEAIHARLVDEGAE